MRTNIDDIINESFNSIELPNKDIIWGKLEKKLDEKSDRKKAIWFRKLFPFFLIMFITAVTIYISDKNTKTNIGVVSQKELRPTISPSVKNSINKKELQLSDSNNLENEMKVIDKKENLLDPSHNSFLYSSSDKQSKTLSNPIQSTEHPKALISTNPMTSIEDVKMADSKTIIQDKLEKPIDEPFVNQTNFDKDSSLKPEEKVASLENSNIKDTSIDDKKDENNIKKKKENSKKLNQFNNIDNWNFGLMMGVNYNKFNPNNKVNNPFYFYNLGVLAQFKLKDNFGINNTLSISSEALNSEFYDFYKENYQVNTIHACKNLQLNSAGSFKYKKLNFEIGPYIGYTFKLNGTSKYYDSVYIDNTTNHITGNNLLSSENTITSKINKQVFKRFDYGFQIGLSRQIQKFSVGLRYTQGLRKFISYNYFDLSFKTFSPHHYLSLTMSYQFK